MNKAQLPGQSWTQVGKRRDPRWICSLCGQGTRDRYGHNQHHHNPDAAKQDPKEATDG